MLMRRDQRSTLLNNLRKKLNRINLFTKRKCKKSKNSMRSLKNKIRKSQKNKKSSGSGLGL